MTLPYVFCIIQGIQGVSKIKDGYNPATWMLEVTTISQEQILGLEFSDIYKKSELYQYVNLILSEILYLRVIVRVIYYERCN
jgi:hypothetical protein